MTRRSCAVCDSGRASLAASMLISGATYRVTALAIGSDPATVSRHALRCMALTPRSKGRRCSVCDHPDVMSIDDQLERGDSTNRGVAKTFGLTTSAVWRHAAFHVNAEWAAEVSHREVARLAFAQRLVTAGAQSFAPAPREAECGTTAGYARHRSKGEPSCPECRAAVAAYQRQRNGSSERVLSPCGTFAAYRRHLRRGDTPCTECRAANAARMREYNRKKASK